MKETDDYRFTVIIDIMLLRGRVPNDRHMTAPDGVFSNPFPISDCTQE
jgi:hypothetical protein